MEIESYQSQNTKIWPGKISVVVVTGEGSHSVKEIEQELQRSFTTTAVVFCGKVGKQDDLPIVAKRLKLKNKLIRIDIDGTNPEQLETMMTRKVVDYISLTLPAPLYKESFDKVGAKNFEKVRESVKLLDSSKIAHEIILNWGELTEEDVKDAASQVRELFILYADKGFDELRAMATQLTGPNHIKIRNKGGEQFIN